MLHMYTLHCYMHMCHSVHICCLITINIRICIYIYNHIYIYIICILMFIIQYFMLIILVPYIIPSLSESPRCFVLFSLAMATWCGFWCSNERMWTRSCMACRSWVPWRKCPRGIVSALSLYSICFKLCVCNVFYVYIYNILYKICTYYI